MAHLFLAIMCSASIALLFKVSENRNYNRYLLTSANYLVASVVAGILWFSEPLSFAVVWGDTTLPTMMIIGVLTGIIYYLAFLCYQISVRHYGVSLSGAYMKLGIFLPLIMSLFVWQEWPNPGQWAGIACAAGAILFINLYPLFTEKTRSQDLIKPALLILFLLGGIAEFSPKVFRQLVNPDLKSLFLLLLFFVALLASLTGLFRHRNNLTLSTFLMGILVGIPNALTAYFLISALGVLPAALVYAVFGAGTILVIGAAGWICWNEKPSTTERIGFFLIVVAMIISNF